MSVYNYLASCRITSLSVKGVCRMRVLQVASAALLLALSLSGCVAYDVASTAVSVTGTAVGAAGTVVGGAVDVASAIVTAPFGSDDSDKKSKD